MVRVGAVEIKEEEEEMDVDLPSKDTQHLSREMGPPKTKKRKGPKVRILSASRSRSPVLRSEMRLSRSVSITLSPGPL
jgi:hypothetical protein